MRTTCPSLRDCLHERCVWTSYGCIPGPSSCHTQLGVDSAMLWKLRWCVWLWFYRAMLLVLEEWRHEGVAYDLWWESNRFQRTMLFHAFPILVLVIHRDMCWSFYDIDSRWNCYLSQVSQGLDQSSRFYELKKFSPKAEVLTFPCVDGLLLLNSLLISSTSLKCSSGTGQMVTCLKSFVRISSSLPRMIWNRDPPFAGAFWSMTSMAECSSTALAHPRRQRRNCKTGGFKSAFWDILVV